MTDTEFPPAPWRLRGRMWAGLFRAEAPIGVPAGFRSLIGKRCLVVLLARYEAGTLRYDELALGVPARRGLRLGLWVEAMWVSDAAALSGGRRIWGVPKQMAQFTWENNGAGVRIEDAAGPVAALTLDSRIARLPVPWLPAPFFGRREAAWLFTRARVHSARLGPGRMRVREWSARFRYRVGEKPLLGVAAPTFRLIVPPPVEM